MNNTMTWTTPVLVEICVGLEINGYLPAGWTLAEWQERVKDKNQ